LIAIRSSGTNGRSVLAAKRGIGHYACVRRALGVVFFSFAVLGLLACSDSSSGSKGSTAANAETLKLRLVPPGSERADMEAVRTIMTNRFVADGFAGVTVDLDPASQLLTIRFPARRAPTNNAALFMIHPQVLRFRLVQGTVPYSGRPAFATARESTCENGKAVTPDRPELPVIRPDKDKMLCYVLGPAILTGRNIGAATATVNKSSGAWEVDVHFKNNDFVDKVAGPNVDKQVAIVLDGIVQSAPTIQPGITGQNVTITGNFSGEEAHQLALVLRYGALPLQLQFVSLRPGNG
jgi:preprotein translocase subunit SecD